MSTDAMMNSKNQYLDKEKLMRFLPKGTNHKVTDEIMSLVHHMEKDTGLLQEYLEESLLSHLPVLQDIKVDLPDYINAIKYCNLKRNMSNEKAWEIVFPERYKKLNEEGRWNTSHPSMYNSSKIVVKIDASMIVGDHIQYAPMHHKMMMKQFELANGISADGTPVSPQVQHLAAKTILEMTMQPEDNTVELKIGQSDEAKASQEKIYTEMTKIAKNQQELLKAGHSIEEVQKLNLKVEVEPDDAIDADYE